MSLLWGIFREGFDYLLEYTHRVFEVVFTTRAGQWRTWTWWLFLVGSFIAFAGRWVGVSNWIGIELQFTAVQVVKRYPEE